MTLITDSCNEGNHVKKRVSTHLLNINFYMRNYRNYILYLVTL